MSTLTQSQYNTFMNVLQAKKSRGKVTNRFEQKVSKLLEKLEAAADEEKSSIKDQIEATIEDSFLFSNYKR